MKKLFFMFAVSALLVSCGESTKTCEQGDSTKVCCKDSSSICDSAKTCTADTSKVDTTAEKH